ncbi:MAG: hypothetical protein HY904_07250 [Deltaproteobacteria bacterium]|nr:hypothetical protein [Deltaproteobacteria bacterium]
MRRHALALAGAGAFVALGLACPWLPGVTVPGYLQALVVSCAAGLFLPWPALTAARWLDGRTALPGAWTVAAGATAGMWPALFSSAVGGWSGTLCEPGPAWLHVLLGPVATGAVVGAAAWAVAGWVAPGWRGALAVAGMLGSSVCHSLWVVYAEPQVFALDHVFGHFRGPIYDEGNADMQRPLALRATSLAWVAWLLAAGMVGRRRARRADLKEPGLLFAAATLAWWGTSAATAATVRPGRAGLLAQLPGELRTAHAVIHADLGRWPLAARRRLALEVERHITEITALAEVTGPETVEVFLYASAEEKHRLTGAGHTLVARPWARQVHVQGTSLPVGALRHELAHVLLAPLGGGPFRIPALWGVVPNALLVEGAATALEEDEGRLGLHQRAAVMERMGRLPRVEALVSPTGFFRESGPRAYTAAGSFLRFLVEKHGGAALARVYRAGTLRTEGINAAALEEEWVAMLRATEVPPQEAAQARRVFQRASVLDRRCVDEAQARWQRAAAHAGNGRWDDATREWRRLLELEPDNDEPLLAMAEWYARTGEPERRTAVLAELDGRRPDDPARLRLALLAAEEAVQHDDWPALADALTRAEPLAAGTAQERQATLLRAAADALLARAAAPPCGALAVGILRFILGAGPERARARSDLLALREALDGLPADATCGSLRAAAEYLVGRQLVADDPGRALRDLDDATAHGLPAPALDREARRLRGEALENRADFRAAVEVYEQLGRTAADPTQQLEARRLLARARFAAAGGLTPDPSPSPAQ